MNNKFSMDLGCASIRIGETEELSLRREPSVVAIHRRDGVVAAVGKEVENEAILSDTSLALLRPFREGLTANYDITYHVLDTVLKRAFGRAARGGELLVGVPCDIDPVAEAELIEAALRTGIKSCHLVYTPLAAMASAEISPEADCLTVDIGAARTNIMLLCRGELVHMKTVYVGGESFDRAIAEYLLKKHHVQISMKVAEHIKREIGTVWSPADQASLSINVLGKHIKTGAAVEVNVQTNEMLIALEEPMAQLLEPICIAVSKVPLPCVRTVFERGIILSGGGACLKGIPRMIEGVTGVKCRRLENPEYAVIRGLTAISKWLLAGVPDSVRNISRFYIENYMLMQQ